MAPVAAGSAVKVAVTTTNLADKMKMPDYSNKAMHSTKDADSQAKEEKSISQWNAFANQFNQLTINHTAGCSTKVMDSSAKGADSQGKAINSSTKDVDPQAKAKESIKQWNAFANQSKQLPIYTAADCDPTYAINAKAAKSDGNKDGNTHDTGALADEAFVGGMDARPLHFYRSDGKLFYRQFDPVVANKVDEGWDDDEVEDQPGHFARPTYTTAPGKSRKEVNYARWKLVEVTEQERDYEYLLRNTWAVESLLNNYDFNQPDDEKVKLRPLQNFLGMPLSKLYPKGQQLLIKESKRGGGPEWKPGQPLGPDPNNKENRTTHIGWVPPRFRKKGRGLGADPTDAVYKHWFFGDLDVPLPDNFVEPEAPWSKNSDRKVRMKSVVTKTNPVSHEFVIMSRESLKRKHYVPPKERAPGHRPSLPWFILRPRQQAIAELNPKLTEATDALATDALAESSANKRRCINDMSAKPAMAICTH